MEVIVRGVPSLWDVCIGVAQNLRNRRGGYSLDTSLTVPFISTGEFN